MELPRSLVKDFANITTKNDGATKKTIYVRGTVKMVSDKKFVQLDGSDSITPLTETVDVQDGDRVLVSIENHVATVIGNFSFPPSARKEQEALNKAEDANNSANNANTNATEAHKKAEEASTKADEAIRDASSATNAANEAKQNAQEAITAAGNASQSAEDAKKAALDASTSAGEARQEAEKAQNAVAGANEEINRINGEVVNVKGELTGALDELQRQAGEIAGTKEVLEHEYSKKTEVALVEANLKTEITKKVGELETTVSETYAAKNDVTAIEGKLQSQITQNKDGITSTVSKVEKIESDTEEAQKKVDQALSSAFDAQAAADQAREYANKAQADAELAKQNANIAATKAEQAKKDAEEARALVEAADLKLTEAKTSLKEAEENLKNIVNNGGTEEEIAEAQRKVDLAKETVNQALKDVAEAEYTAQKAQEASDKAQADAIEAQNVATEADKKATNAELVAQKAQEAADVALKKVAELTKKIDDAQTAIRQNSEQIELSAKKIEEIGNRKSVTETTVYWYLSQSATELIGGEWVEGTAPAWKDGSYYWQKVITKYFDGSIKESSPICLTGPSGKPGEDGTTGVGIESTVISYAASESGTSVPENNWGATIPDVQPNQYLWTRTTITYTDNTTSVAYSVGKIGANGEPGNDGKPGENGSDGIGVKNTEVTYQSSQNGSIIPSGNWGEGIPEVPDGSYLWTRTVITYTNDTTTTMYSVSKMGEKGDQGIPGPKGDPGTNGSDGKTSYFHIKYSEVDNPTNSSQITETPNIYIGTYVDFIQEDSTDPTKYSWSRFQGIQGEKGDQGIPGTDGSNGRTSYLHIAYSNSYDGTIDFSVSDSTNKLYIGTYVDFIQEDSTDPTKYSWTKIKGEPGNDGTGIESITVEYYLSSSKNEQIDGTWQTTMPDWVVDKYLWIRNKIVYKNPTSIVYTTPYCDSSWEASKDVSDDLHNNYYNKVETDAQIKVESNKITTTVKETITEEVDKVQETADEAKSTADSNESRLTISESSIKQLSDSISQLVTDENGNSLMTQTSGGWTFNIGGINENLNDAKNKLNDVAGKVDSVDKAIDGVNDLANDLAKKTAYMNITTVDGQPAIELGQSSNSFKLRITNTSIDFLEGSSRVAYISNKVLYIEKAIIKNELQFGDDNGFVWKRRSNGNLGLRWIGGNK